MNRRRLALGIASWGWCIAIGMPAEGGAGVPVDYNRDVRPILSNVCYQCHGPDAKTRQAGLRLDIKREAFKKLDSDQFAIVPGDRAKSQLVSRIAAKDPGERMPPPESGKSLTPGQIELLSRWVDQGAPWREHWSLVRPERPAEPKSKFERQVRNAIDRFIFSRLENEGLEPSPEADKPTLVRRATLDLTGLPPTLAEIDAFVADRSPNAYEKLVDRLLASPRYGEHMARDWLDLVRYADTHGLHLDNERSLWPYRDWLIASFNKNMPYDRFTIEQLAGDLLPSPTLEQRIATGLNRCNVTTSEGGAIDEEFRVRYAVDRTQTMGTVWLGLTVGCAVCHDHKFDPISQKEFYQLYAFFNSTKDAPMDGNALLPPPVVRLPSPEQGKQQQSLQNEIAEIQKRIRAEPSKANCAPMEKKLAETKKRLADMEAAMPASMVTEELTPPREAFVLKRGEYDKRGDKVGRGVPAAFPPLAKGGPLNRLGLAQWLVDPSHPLTARVAVNRFWQHYFGTGIVKTSEDFGAQGEWPSHPELLDWLAAEFISSGWDVKHVERVIATSATYRQSSRVTPQLLQKDPENRLLARGPRFRMDAEMVRDTALAVSGLLVGTIGGHSGKPYQPPGLWEAVGYTTSNTAKFVQDHGDPLYRRSMYIFWKRTSPPPVMSLLDAPNRETCVARRARTNTPVAALALLNESGFVEAARALGQRMMLQGGAKPEERIAFAFRLATARRPAPEEMQVLLDEYRTHLAEFRRDREAALRLLSVGESKRDNSLDPAEHAAWTMVANTILNLDETVTKG